MNHEPQFSKPSNATGSEVAAKELAACYARVFLGDDDGKRVWEDLCKKFGLHRVVFQRAESGRYDTIGAALIDGERHVILEIENALKIGAPGQANKLLSQPK